MSIYITLSVVLLISFILTYLVRKAAIKKSILDIPNHRSSHSVPTPRGGGIAIMIAWYVGVITLYIMKYIELNLFLALASGSFLSVISIIDDIRNVKPKVRLLFQALSAIGALYFIGYIRPIDLFVFQISSQYILFPLFFIAILWFINLFNFLDGIDGHIAIAGITIPLGLYIFSDSQVLLIMVAAVLGFLPWNWQRAKIFMGDVGSTLIGFNVVILSLWFRNTANVSIIVILVLSSLYWFDATLTLVRRFLNKEKLSEAHRKHAYQRIVQYGFSHQKTVMFAIIINIIFFTTVYMLKENTHNIFLLIGCLLINMAVHVYVEKKKRFE
ncbi:MAG: glycosyltransferase family 4 protein [Bacteroidales bacterium]|jgi:Fuc2NAc and GlcNAc transferase|nr:glycosyltransferase family 4 protein [Bacteroidales bacterium]